MTKKQKYWMEIQKMAISSECVKDFIGKVEKFNKNQTILKRFPLKKLSEITTIYYLEYVEHRLEVDFKNRKDVSTEIYDFLYRKINGICLELKTITTDEVVINVLKYKKDKINSIVDKDYDMKKEKIKELEKEIEKLKSGRVV